MKVKFKKSFLKDFERLPMQAKSRIEKIVFREIPAY
jgi:mRNA-degrading endonuclease RelE of RelBE toxin-antitoxin system